MGRSERKPTFSPASRAADTALARVMSSINRSFALANTSTAKRPFTSVAVVSTGVALSCAARSSARALAPPRCPLSRGMTKVPPSSMTSTAGSVRLSRTWGAMARTAMPEAQTNTRASACRNPSPAHAEADWVRGSSPAPQNLGRAKVRQLWPVARSISAILAPRARPRAV